MGLDMYARKTRASVPAVDFELPDGDEEFHYWRKHPNLHGWMEALYRTKGGSAETFNCTPVTLTPEDLDRLEAVIRGRQLPRTQGFFFGSSSGDDEEIEDDLAFVAAAREAIAEGFTVYYTSWW